MKITLPAILVVLLCLSLLPEPVLLAASEEGQTQNNLFNQPPEEQEPPVSRREASDIARANFPGRVLSIRLENMVWRVRMDQDGTVFNVLVDARSGQASRASE